MFPSCEPCGGLERWHPQVHVTAERWSGCVDEDLGPLVGALVDLASAPVTACQDYLQSGRVRLRFASAEEARRLLDEVVRAGSVELLQRILEAAVPPRVDIGEWAVDVDVDAGGLRENRVVGLPISVSFPRTDLAEVLGCLTAPNNVADPIASTSSPEDMTAIGLNALVSRAIHLADFQVFDLLDLDRANEAFLERVLGDAWMTEGPGFAEGVGRRPSVTTWVALRATVTSLWVPDPRNDPHTLDQHLAEIEHAEEWCLESYARLDPEVHDQGDVERRHPGMWDGPDVSREHMARWPHPSMQVWVTARELNTVTASPRRIDPIEVRVLLARAMVELDDHRAELELLASEGHYPIGDSRYTFPFDPTALVSDPTVGVRSLDAERSGTVAEFTRDGFVVIVGPKGVRQVRQGNLRLQIEATREACGLPEQLSWACAVRHDVTGRLARISFVRCGPTWHPTVASRLKAGDRIREDFDYHYVVDRVFAADDASQVVISRSGRGWLAVEPDFELQVQRP